MCSGEKRNAIIAGSLTVLVGISSALFFWKKQKVAKKLKEWRLQEGSKIEFKKRVGGRHYKGKIKKRCSRKGKEGLLYDIDYGHKEVETGVDKNGIQPVNGNLDNEGMIAGTTMAR